MRVKQGPNPKAPGDRSLAMLCIVHYMPFEFAIVAHIIEGILYLCRIASACLFLPGLSKADRSRYEAWWEVGVALCVLDAEVGGIGSEKRTS